MSKSVRWWTEGAKEPHKTIVEIVTRLKQQGWRDKYRALEQIYSEATMSPSSERLFGAVFGNRAHDVWQRTPVTRSLVDAQLNRIGRAKPSPRFFTRQGDWHAEERARLSDAWVAGMFERLNMHTTLGREVLLDGLVLGMGVLKGSIADGGEPILERVHPVDIHVDKREERAGCIRTMYQSFAIDRGVLMEMYPESREDIECAEPYDDAENPEDGESSDLVEVIEAWRLPNGRDEDGYCIGGRHLIVIENCILNPDDDGWHRDSFPFVFYYYRKRPRSFRGLGIVESTACMQADLNDLDDVFAQAYNLMTPGIVVQTGSVVRKTIDNEVGKIIEVDGGPASIQPWVPPAVAPDFLNRAEQLETRMGRMEGISPFSSQSMKPAGLDSGAAILAHEDIESERHAIPSQNYEQFFIDSAKMLLVLASEVLEDEELSKTNKLRVLGTTEFMEEIDFADAQLEPDEFVMRCTPVSALSRSFTGKLEQVAQMREMGAFEDPAVLELLEIPDTERLTQLNTSGRRLVRKLVSNALRGKPFHIHPYLPMDYLVTYATQQRSVAELQGAPASALERLDTLIGAALDEQKRALEAVAPPPPPPAPMGPPMMGPPMLDPAMAGMPPVMPPGPPMGPDPLAMGMPPMPVGPMQ